MTQKGNIIIVLVIIAVLAAGIIVYFKSKSSTAPSGSQPTTTSTPAQTKTFQSQSMKFSIELPPRFQAAERLGSVTASSKDGDILIGQNGTNFDNLKDYIRNSQNNLEARLTDRKELKINGLEAISGFIDKEKIYFLYTENRVYLISTKTPSLFDDLDQLAQSFKYTP